MDEVGEVLAEAGSDTHEAAERVYEAIAGEDEEDRSCEALPEEACREIPGNFLLNVGNGACTKLAEQLASPGLVLPWMLGAVGVPTAITGLLVPVRRAGSLLPQLAVAGRIRARPVRKWYWVGAGLVQALCLLTMIPALLLLPPLGVGVAVVGALAAFSAASGVGSVAFKDVLAKTIPRGRRGRLLGMRATIGGLLALGAAGGLRFQLAEDDSLAPYIVLLVGAAALWVVASFLMGAMSEVEGAVEGGRNALEEARDGWRFLREQPDFARFVGARALLLAAQLAAPFYALQAQGATGSGVGNLAALVMASSFAAVISSPFWGRFSDASSRRVMVAGGVWTTITVALALSSELLPEGTAGLALFVLVFLSSGFAVAGVRLGRKTYLVDGAPAELRPLMVAVANTLVGVMYAVAAVFGLLAEWLGVPWVLVLLGLMALVGTVMAHGLPEAEGLVRREG